MKNVGLLIISLYLVACGGSSGGGSVPVYVGTYKSDCFISSGDSALVTLEITSNHYKQFTTEFSGNTTCSGVGIDISPTIDESFALGEHSASTYVLQFSSSYLMIKVEESKLILDTGSPSAFDPDWDYVADGSYAEYTKQ